MASAPNPEARELSLIDKVEMRIALADTDAKLETLLKTYLAPLLLKLASDSVKVRNKVISVCQHINTRIKPQAIQLPVAALLKQFKDSQDVSLIRHFDMLYIQQGISRLPVSERLELLPVLIHGIASDSKNSASHGSQLFNLFLRLLIHFQLPPRGSKEDDELRKSLNVIDEDAEFIASWIGKLLLLGISRASQNISCPGLSVEDYQFLSLQGKSEVWDPSSATGLNLSETKVIATKLLVSGLFIDTERFFPGLLASADANPRISEMGDDLMKRVLPNISLEDASIINKLYEIYFGKNSPDGPPPARIALKIKILSLFAKSITSTKYPEQIARLVEEGLGQAETSGDKSNLGREASKFRSAIFSFLNFAARNAATSDLKSITPGLIDRLKGFIQDQGWPKPDRDDDLPLRGFSYEVIGLLAKASPEVVLMDPELRLLNWLFSSLREDFSSKGTIVSIEEGLSSILSIFSTQKLTHSGQKRFKRILLSNMLDNRFIQNPDQFRSTRYVTTRFANRCLPYSDVLARWIDILAIGSSISEPQELIEEGKKGLDPYWYMTMNASNGEASSINPKEQDVINLPDLVELISFIFCRTEPDEIESVDSVKVSDPYHTTQQFLKLYPNSFAPAIQYIRLVLLHTSLTEKGMGVATSVDWERKLETAVHADPLSRRAVQAFLKDTENKDRIASVAILLRSAFSSLALEESTGFGEAGNHFVELCSLSPEHIWLQAQLPQALTTLEGSIYANASHKRAAASHAFGLLASHEQCDQAAVLEFLSRLISQMKSWKTAVGAQVNKASGAILSLGYFFSRLSFRGRLDSLSDTVLNEFLETLFDILKSSKDTTLLESTFKSIEQLSIFFVISPSIIEHNSTSKTVIDQIFESASGGNQTAIMCLGSFAMIFEDEINDSKDMSNFRYAEEKLFKLHEIRQTESQFTVGEALSCAIAGWQSEALSTSLDIIISKEQSSSWSDAPITPEGPKRVGTVARIFELVLKNCRVTKPSLKKASVIWLLCLLQYCGHLHEIQSFLPQCQIAFKSCLADRDELVQEAASRGLGMVYERGDRELREDLVRDLVGSFSDNKSKLAGSVTADTELFDAGALPTGDGSITTYKDILNLASEVGDSSLVYRFMSLAANNSIWSSRAAFGRFGLRTIFSDSSVDEYLAENTKLYPALFRYRFDPNPNVQRSMNDIWIALVKNPSLVIEQHFEAIMEDLLRNILGKEWRVRQASCAAIADLVQGRPLEKYEIYLNKIWAACFKVLDDIKDSVRRAATSLARVLTGVLTRSLEAGESSAKNADTMLKDVLPFLLSTSGLESGAKEVQIFALHTLLQIVKKSTGKVLRPFIPDLVERLIGLLGSLEPQEINYLHLNASKYNLTEQKIDDMRLASVRGSPLMEAIEQCLTLSDEVTMKDLVAHIEIAMKTAVALPSKVGCSRILVTLSTRHNFLFRPYADHFLKLLEKYIHDRNDTVSSSYAAAVGYVCRISSDKQVLQMIDFCKKLYFKSEDDRQRLYAGDIIHSISKHASDRFNSFNVELLPFIFVAKHDSDTQVKDLFQDSWNDNVGGSRAVLLYAKEIITLAQEYLDSPRWILKHTAARTIADAVMSITSSGEDISLINSQIIWPALDTAMSGKTWDGKEVVLDAFAHFVEKGSQLWSKNSAIGEQIVKVIIREARRQNKTYRQYAIRALGKVSAARKDIDMSATVHEIAGDIIKEYTTTDEDAMEVDGGDDKVKSNQILENTLSGAVDSIFKSINTELKKGPDLAKLSSEAFHLAVEANGTNITAINVATWEALTSFFDKVEKLDPSSLSPEPARIEEDISKLLFNPRFDDLPEAIRMKRAQAIVSTSKVPWQAISSKTFEEAVTKERSMTVKKELEKLNKK